MADGVWHDLNDASDVSLDIYYEPENGGERNGYRYNKELNLNIDQDKLPCIVLWKNNKSKRVVICIGGLNKTDIIKVMIRISRMAKKLYPIEAIQEAVQKYVDDMHREKQKNNTVVINNAPVFTNTNTNTNETKVSITISYENVFQAISQSQLSEEDKNALIGMVADIEQLKKKKDETKIWGKVRSVFGWIANKAVDIGLAVTLVPYLTEIIKGIAI